MPHLLVAITPHGFGHVAQAAAVVGALRERLPSLEVTLRTTVPRDFLETRFSPPFHHQVCADDFGMVQQDALGIDRAASARAYLEFHAGWDGRVEAAVRAIAAAGPDLVLADVPYLTLAAAARLGVSAVAMSCLNWADIYAHYFRDTPGAAGIHERMLTAYDSARVFLRTEPAMPMTDLARVHTIGPIMRPLGERRDAIRARAGLRADERLVLVAMGGFGTRPPMEAWPTLRGGRWVAQRDWAVRRADVVAFEDLGLRFGEALACADALVTKPGYGAFSEAAAYGLPVVAVRRPDWPEAPYLEEWLARRVPLLGIDRGAFERGDFVEVLDGLLDRGRVAPTAPTGIDEAVAYLAPLLGIRKG